MSSDVMLSNRRAAWLVCAALVFTAWVNPARAQTGEGGPVKIVVGFPPGGSLDTIARLLGEKLQTHLKRPVLVENRPGAGGRLAVDTFKNAPADGSVVMIAPDTISVSAPIVFKKLTYDPARDFVPVSTLVQFPFALAVGEDPKAAVFADYVRWAKANPARASFGSPAPGSPPHFFGLVVGRAIGVDMVHVPFQGTAPIVTNLAGGQVSAGISTVGDLMEHHRGGRIRIVAVSAAKRIPQLPDVPTFTELGYPEVVGQGFIGLYVPPKASPAVIQQWNQSIRGVLALPDVQERLRNLGLEPTPSTPQELSQLTSAEIGKWQPIIRASGFSLD
ncbi:Bug family tripartite tricarboxylate transporter substrate binding protein [Ramlibacter sp. WS9]|uniref:Bug family tripartite tricarboxylate transporter substrate binding protein n=1 Tax=Ramlibacter sp. WS9 TaxID=1882741 RepID=UPI00130521A5|nr:Bug family tripartite tricarboxylate transporter substrate binding protein [Ramlibacter sp. WS9]HSV36676.1 Bug family tripartite tricarboxylate transporter substrate binding protein [Ramlibacter sp.]